MSPTLHERRSINLLFFLFVSSLAGGLHGAAAAEDGELARELGEIKHKQLDEISGMAASRLNPGILWLHNDGNIRQVFAVTTSGDLAAQVRLPVGIEDTEDVAIGPGPMAGADFLYLGDIGDNERRRREVRVVRFAEPKLPVSGNGQIHLQEAEVFRLIYPDGPHNAEALIVDPVSGDLFIVTKEKHQARLFACSADRLDESDLVTLDLAGTLDIDEISGGAIAPDGRRIILRREDQGWLWNRRSGQSVAAAVQLTPQPVQVRGPRQGPNGESVSFSPEGRSYYTVSEGKKQVICEFQVPASAIIPSR